MEDMLLQVKQLLEEKNYVKLKSILDDMNPADIALLLENIAEDELPLIFRILSKEIASDTFVEMSSDSQELLINAFSDTELKAVIEDMFLDDTVDIIEEMPANVVRRILNQANPDTRSAINELLQYPKDSAGTIMTVEYISLKSNMTVKQCFDHIRKNAINKETIYTCYVTDPQRKLLGLVSVKDLLLNTYETVVGDIMETNVIYAFTSTDKEEVAGMFSKYGFSALPIVDNEQ
ncbi:MAG: CBS domain-containing protein, partial [Clostridia bacterium]